MAPSRRHSHLFILRSTLFSGGVEQQLLLLVLFCLWCCLRFTTALDQCFLVSSEPREEIVPAVLVQLVGVNISSNAAPTSINALLGERFVERQPELTAVQLDQRSARSSCRSAASSQCTLQCQ